MGDVTLLLRAATKGNNSAAEQLFSLIYSDLRTLARSALRSECSNHTLTQTAVVHEAYLRIFPDSNLTFNERRQFFALASKVMRQVLVDHARRKKAEKRGGGVVAEALDEAIPSLPRPADEILVVHEGLDRLKVLDSRQAQMIEMRYFGGMEIDEIAAHFAVSSRTVKRELQTGRLLLRLCVDGDAGCETTTEMSPDE